MRNKWLNRYARMSGLREPWEDAPHAGFPRISPGQSCPQHCLELGQPISIREAAALIGCSAWTVRQKHVPHGLPCLRSGRNGRLIFYRDQVIRWVLERQQKGVMYR